MEKQENIGMKLDLQSNRKTDVLQEEDFKRLSQFIYTHYGINLYPAKRILLQSRLQKRLIELGLDSYKKYCDLVLNENVDAQEIQEMVECVTTNKTEFFRESKAFDFCDATILPEFLKRKESGQVYSVWSAGCSTGKEPYSLGIFLNELAGHNPGFDFQIHASDISVEVLKTAQMAIYPMQDIQEIPIRYRKNNLLKSKDSKKQQIRIVPEIREKVRFFWLNLLAEDYKISQQFDLIFCRNTMIYFDRITQKKIVEKFEDLLNPGAYLVLGQSESLINLEVELKQVAPSIYKKF